MFAEFEKITHALVEAGEPLTVERFKSEYRKLLELLLRPRFRDRRRAVARMLPHSALLSRVLRLQIRHRPVGRDRPGRARRQRRQAGTGRLPGLPQGRLLEVPARPAARRRRRHGAAGGGRHGARLFRAAGRRAGRVAVIRNVHLALNRTPGVNAMQLGLVTYQWGAEWDLPTLIKNLRKDRLSRRRAAHHAQAWRRAVARRGRAQGSRQAVCR